MGKIQKREKIIWITCLAIISCIIVFEWGIHKKLVEKHSAFIENTIGLMSLAIAGVSVYVIMLQLRQSRRIQEAEFIVHLNQAFVENTDYAKVYVELENSRHGNKKPNLSKIEISNYLTFFETIYILLNQKAISIKNLDDLFEYRFFLAIHNETVQKKKLVESPYNFRNIYCLEKLWTEYRKKTNFQFIMRRTVCTMHALERGKRKSIKRL